MSSRRACRLMATRAPRVSWPRPWYMHQPPLCLWLAMHRNVVVAGAADTASILYAGFVSHHRAHRGRRDLVARPAPDAGHDRACHGALLCHLRESQANAPQPLRVAVLACHLDTCFWFARSHAHTHTLAPPHFACLLSLASSANTVPWASRYAGVFARVSAVVVTSPLELVRTNLQANRAGTESESTRCIAALAPNGLPLTLQRRP